jgi:hypothetical protein
MTKQMSAAAAVLGKKGGKASGKSKVRGDADYYRKLALKRWGKVKGASE